MSRELQRAVDLLSSWLRTPWLLTLSARTARAGGELVRHAWWCWVGRDRAGEEDLDLKCTGRGQKNGGGDIETLAEADIDKAK